METIFTVSNGLFTKKTILMFAMLLVILIMLLIGFFLVDHPSKQHDRCLFVAMDTFFEIQSSEVVDWSKIEALAEAKINHLDLKLNTYNQESEIANINKNAKIKPIVVSEDTYSWIQKAIQYGKLSGGLFDITFQPLQDLYGFDNSQYCVPDQRMIERAKQKIGYDKIILNESEKSVFLPESGIKLNLSGLIKGIVLDEISQLLKESGIRFFTLNFGGNLYIQSDKEEKIGIKSPYDSKIITTIQVKNAFVSTSSNGEQYFIKNGQRYSHIINPKNGKAYSFVDSVTVATDSGVESDFLSTYLYLLPPDQSKKVMQLYFPNAGYYIIQKNKMLLYQEPLP